MKVLKKCFEMMPVLYDDQKRQWDMMLLLLSESAQKILSDDAHTKEGNGS